MELLDIDEVQSTAILDMQLRRLAALERQKIIDEYDELMIRIADYNDILASEARQRSIVAEELAEITEKYGDDRRTDFVAWDGDVTDEDLIAEEDVVVTITSGGYAKRTKSELYRSQRRGGKGVRGASLRQDDVVEHMFVSTTHHWILFFTNKGRVYRAKAYQLPEAARAELVGRGVAVSKSDDSMGGVPSHAHSTGVRGVTDVAGMISRRTPSRSIHCCVRSTRAAVSTGSSAGNIAATSSVGRSPRPLVANIAHRCGRGSSVAGATDRSRMAGRTSSVLRCPFRSRSTNSVVAASVESMADRRPAWSTPSSVKTHSHAVTSSCSDGLLAASRSTTWVTW